MLKIGDFSSLSQVSIKTLRYYDERGLLSPAHVDSETGYRYYLNSSLPSYFSFSEAMSMTNRYFTSPFSTRSNASSICCIGSTSTSDTMLCSAQ